MTVHKFTALSIFSGAMGLDLGLELTGKFHFLACLEKEPVFCKTIRKNKQNGYLSKDLKIYQGDIADFSPQAIMEELQLAPGELDLLVGGPPCQSFSTAGKRKSTQDPRGTLLWQFLHFVEVLKPKFFLMENVRGLKSAALKHRPIANRPSKGGDPLSCEEKPGTVIKLFANDLQKIDQSSYHLDCFEVNSVNYGAPQIRERLLFIGNRYNKLVNFPDPTHTGGSKTTSVKQLNLFETEPSLLPWRTLRDAIGDLEEKDPEILDFSPRKKHFLAQVPEGCNWRSLPVEVQMESMGKAFHAKGGRSGWWRRLTYDLPCPTLMTMPNHASTSLCHPVETRALSIREYARIQEFPDYWIFAGTTSQKYTQIGNAVPVRLGRIAGKVIANELLQLEHGEPISEHAHEFRIVYIQSHIRTRKWFDGKKAVAWNNDTQKCQYSLPRTLRKTSALG